MQLKVASLHQRKRVAIKGELGHSNVHANKLIKEACAATRCLMTCRKIFQQRRGIPAKERRLMKRAGKHTQAEHAHIFLSLFLTNYHNVTWRAVILYILRMRANAGKAEAEKNRTYHGQSECIGTNSAGRYVMILMTLSSQGWRPSAL